MELSKPLAVFVRIKVIMYKYNILISRFFHHLTRGKILPAIWKWPLGGLTSVGLFLIAMIADRDETTRLVLFGSRLNLSTRRFLVTTKALAKRQAIQDK
jgi:hypothetical protein